MEAQAKYINDAQQRILSALCLLAGNEMQGLSPSDLAREMKVGASTITRDLCQSEGGGVRRADSGDRALAAGTAAGADRDQVPVGTGSRGVARR